LTFSAPPRGRPRKTGAFAADLRRCAGIDGTRRTLLELFTDNYGLHALLAYRLGRCLLRAAPRYYLWPLLPFGWLCYFLLSRLARAMFDIRLELSADIGPGLYIGHFGAIRVGRCRIGASCSIGRLTTITPGVGKAGPVIGDRVWIGAHAQIVGSYRIGSGSTVAAGAVIQRDVPDGALCLGRPARVVMRNYDNRAILGLSEE
jgi:serine O-acetyltransferase